MQGSSAWRAWDPNPAVGQLGYFPTVKEPGVGQEESVVMAVGTNVTMVVMSPAQRLLEGRTPSLV